LINFGYKQYQTLKKLVALLLLPYFILAQQGLPSSLLLFNPTFEHASYGGMERSLAIIGQTRNTWSQLQGRPSMMSISANMPMYAWKGAISTDVINQREGNLTWNQFRAGYNYVITRNQSLISIGGRFGVHQVGLDGNKIRTPQGSYIDGNLNHNDPTLSTGNALGVGVTWELSALFNKDNLTVAISFSDLASPSIALGKGQYTLDKTAVLTGQYVWNYRDNLRLTPSLTLRTNFNKVQSDLFLYGAFGLKNTVGLGLRGFDNNTLDAAALLFGHRLNEKFSIYYAYDIGISSLRSAHDGTHDLIIKVNLDPLFGKNQRQKISYNPRFL
jgi:type IX secretion system PorP/SprF family membrane protein